MDPQNMIKVYVAGAYSGDTLQTARHIRVGRRLSAELMVEGFAAYCPWNDWELAVILDIPMEAFKNTSLAYMHSCQCVLLAPGCENSQGTKDEVFEASLAGIPVFNTKEELRKWATQQNMERRDCESAADKFNREINDLHRKARDFFLANETAPMTTA